MLKIVQRKVKWELNPKATIHYNLDSGRGTHIADYKEWIRFLEGKPKIQSVLESKKLFQKKIILLNEEID